VALIPLQDGRVIEVEKVKPCVSLGIERGLCGVRRENVCVVVVWV
jgi:hypothetical protein